MAYRYLSTVFERHFVVLARKAYLSGGISTEGSSVLGVAVVSWLLNDIRNGLGSAEPGVFPKKSDLWNLLLVNR